MHKRSQPFQLLITHLSSTTKSLMSLKPIFMIFSFTTYILLLSTYLLPNLTKSYCNILLVLSSQHVKVKLPDENKRRMSKSMRGSSISTASMTSSDNINILNVSSKSSFSEVDSQHLVPKSSGSRCADLCVMS